MKILFNPLNFTLEENNENIAAGWEPLPPECWHVTDRLRQIQRERLAASAPSGRGPGR
jgi:hypothetical protein